MKEGIRLFLFESESLDFQERTLLTSSIMEIRFDGKRALVTGAGKGIGRALTLKLVDVGAYVIAVSRTQSDLDELKKAYPDKIQTLCLDIGKWEATKEALKDIGPVDMLINNAGILEVKQLGDISEEEVDRIFDINVKAIINITQIIANEMKSRGEGGVIVNLSSVAGLYAIPSYTVYSGSKGALDQITKTMAMEYGPHKIRVNSVNPTVVATQMAEKQGFFDPDNKFAKLFRNRTPLRRIAECEDVVGPIIFLLSDYTSMITGITLLVDGGLSVCFT